jgi:hypothetical protein
MMVGAAALSALMVLMSAAEPLQLAALVEQEEEEDAASLLPSEADQEDEVELDLEDRPTELEPADDWLPPEERPPEYLIDPGTKQVLSWVLIGTGGALMVTGVSLYVAHLVVGAPLAELRQEQQEHPDRADVLEADYLERKQTSDLLYISSIVGNATGVLALASGLTLLLLPDEVFENSAQEMDDAE